MSAIFVGVVGVLWALITYQAALTLRFWKRLRRFRVDLVPDSEAPPAEVILCLRGTDPFLEDCLAGLLNQDYPDYRVRIVVDGPQDPAHRTVQEVLGQYPSSRVEVENLTDRHHTCSLKCSALYQVINSLEPRSEIVAQIDADTVPHRTWLRELATALVPADVGAATGNRWYMPQGESLGALVRYVWNASAVTQMLHYQIAWGGTMATKAHVFRESDLLTRWRQAFCEDAMMHSALDEMGLRLAFVPSLMMVNRENISVREFYRWIKRQMLIVRHYHAAWRLILLQCSLSTFTPLVGLGLLISGAGADKLFNEPLLLWSLNIFAVSYFLCLLPLIGAIRKIVAHRGDSTLWITRRGILKILIAFPLTTVVYAAAVFSAVFARHADWRGIRYQFAGPWQVRMEKYVPYQSASSDNSDNRRDEYRSVA